MLLALVNKQFRYLTDCPIYPKSQSCLHGGQDNRDFHHQQDLNSPADASYGLGIHPLEEMPHIGQMEETEINMTMDKVAKKLGEDLVVGGSQKTETSRVALVSSD